MIAGERSYLGFYSLIGNVVGGGHAVKRQRNEVSQRFAGLLPRNDVPNGSWVYNPVTSIRRSKWDTRHSA